MRNVDDSNRRWLVPLAATLLILALWMLLSVKRKTGGEVTIAGRDLPAPSGLPAESLESAAEKARRAAIAALGPIKHRGVNAADLYKQALVLYARLTNEEKGMLKHPRAGMDADTAAALYAKIQPIMDLLRSARKADYMDWGTGPMMPDTDISARFQMERDLSGLALWESDYRFQSDPDGAVSDLAALDTMGRNEADSLLGLLVGNNIQLNTMDLLAQNAGAITGAAGQDLADILSPAAAEQSFQGAMNGSASMMQALLDEYNNPATRSDAYIQKSMNSVTPQEAASEVQWMEQTDQAFGATLMEPESQFLQWWNQTLAASASMPLASQNLPALAAVRAQVQASVAEDAMVAAGIALEQGNQAQFQSITDPVSGQPFTYTQTANGFQLGSALQLNGKPVTLSFSAPAAK